MEYKAKKVFLKDKDGNYLIPFTDTGSGLDDKITNCLLEVPQNIKLELIDGTITLKAGSKVIVPNGAGVFEEKVAQNDATLIGSLPLGEFLIFDNGSVSGTSLRHAKIDRVFSGNTAPTELNANDTWYDTTNNIIRTYQNAQWAGARTLPLAKVTVTANGTNIDQVFNGMGYIGSTVWVDKGVKGLIPNGRNEDGSLKNIEFTTNKVMTSSYTSNSGQRHLVLSEFYFGGYINNIYKSEENINVDGVGNKQSVVNVGYMVITNGVISNFQPKLPFRAVDYNDLQSLLPTGAVISSASSTSPSGFLLANGSAVSRIAYAKLFSVIGTTYGTGDGSTTFNLPNFTTYKFVTSDTVSVKGNGKAIGITDGTNNYGLGSGTAFLTAPRKENYGQNVGVSLGATAKNFDSTIGLTTDASKSGITGSVSTATPKWYIKY